MQTWRQLQKRISAKHSDSISFGWHAFSLPAVSENKPTVFPCFASLLDGVPIGATGVIGLRLEGEAAVAAGDCIRADDEENAERVTSAALATENGCPLELTTHNATLCW